MESYVNTAAHTFYKENSSFKDSFLPCSTFPGKTAKAEPTVHNDTKHTLKPYHCSALITISFRIFPCV